MVAMLVRLFRSFWNRKYLYLSGLNCKRIKVILYCRWTLRQAAVANGRNVKIVPYRNPFSPPWLRKLWHSQCTRPLRPPLLKYTPTWGEPSQDLCRENTRSFPCYAGVGNVNENVNFNMRPDTFLGFLKSHASTVAHTPHPAPPAPQHPQLYASYPQASSKRQILSVPFYWSKKFHKVTNQIFTGMCKKCQFPFHCVQSPNFKL